MDSSGNCLCGKTKWIQLYGDGSTPYYIKKDKNTGCECELPKCPNYDICGIRQPDEILSAFRGFCTECEFICSTYGKKLETNNIIEECPVCMDDKKLYTLPTCNHKLCKDCIKIIFYIDYGNPDDYPEEPIFPYECIGEYGDDNYYDPEEDFNNNPYDPKWENDEKVLEYLEKKNIRETYEERIIKHPENPSCPLCRKK